MNWIKKFETFKKIKNITEEDIIKCIKSGGLIFATTIKNFPEHDPEEPLTPLSIDEDGLVTVTIDGQDYEVELDKVEKIS